MAQSRARATVPDYNPYGSSQISTNTSNSIRLGLRAPTRRAASWLRASLPGRAARAGLRGSRALPALPASCAPAPRSRPLPSSSPGPRPAVRPPPGRQAGAHRSPEPPPPLCLRPHARSLTQRCPPAGAGAGAALSAWCRQPHAPRAAHHTHPLA